MKKTTKTNNIYQTRVRMPNGLIVKAERADQNKLSSIIQKNINWQFSLVQDEKASERELEALEREALMAIAFNAYLKKDEMTTPAIEVALFVSMSHAQVQENQTVSAMAARMRIRTINAEIEKLEGIRATLARAEEEMRAERAKLEETAASDDEYNEFRLSCK